MTKNALADSLKTLLETRTVDKITISDITEHCGVNRMTFDLQYLAARVSADF